MDTNLEDSIHDLRHRIIESVNYFYLVIIFSNFYFQELNHQRRSSDEYIKRTRMCLFLIIIFKKRRKVKLTNNLIYR